MTLAKQFNHDFSKGDFEIFDENDKKVYWETSSGYWIKREFDQNGNEVYWENSHGYSEKQEFDQRGNRLYYENSSGVRVHEETN
jgi:hypothetical protein